MSIGLLGVWPLNFPRMSDLREKVSEHSSKTDVLFRTWFQKWHTNILAIFYSSHEPILCRKYRKGQKCGKGLWIQTAGNIGGHHRSRLVWLSSQFPQRGFPQAPCLEHGVWMAVFWKPGLGREEGISLFGHSHCHRVSWSSVRCFTPTLCGYSWHLTLWVLFGQPLQGVRLWCVQGWEKGMGSPWSMETDGAKWGKT